MKTANPRHRIKYRYAPIADRFYSDASTTYRLTVALGVLPLTVVLVIGGACRTNHSRPLSGSASPASDRRAQATEQTQKDQPISRKKLASALRISLSGRVLQPDAVAIVVGNHASYEVKLADQLEVERYTGVGWKAFDAQDVRLRYSCETNAGKCVALLPGAQLYPPPWQAASGPSQCRSRVGDRAPEGRYRFRAKSCDGAVVIFGEPFQLGSGPSD